MRHPIKLNRVGYFKKKNHAGTIDCQDKGMQCQYECKTKELFSCDSQIFTVTPCRKFILPTQLAFCLGEKHKDMIICLGALWEDE